MLKPHTNDKIPVHNVLVHPAESAEKSLAAVATIVEMTDPEAGNAERSHTTVATIEETTEDMMTGDVHVIDAKSKHIRQPKTHRQHVSNKQSFYLITIV